MKGVRGQRSVSGLRRCTSCISPPREDSGTRDCGEMRMNEWKPLMEGLLLLFKTDEGGERP